MSKEGLLKLLDMVDDRIRRLREKLESLRKLRELVQAKILKSGALGRRRRGWRRS